MERLLTLPTPPPLLPGMSQTRSFSIFTSFFMIGIWMAVTGCASHARYGAAPKHKRGCDCPKWNAVPVKEKKNELRVDMTERNSDLAHLNHGSSH